jgi:hypothetical protein
MQADTFAVLALLTFVVAVVLVLWWLLRRRNR